MPDQFYIFLFLVGAQSTNISTEKFYNGPTSDFTFEVIASKYSMKMIPVFLAMKGKQCHNLKCKQGNMQN